MKINTLVVLIALLFTVNAMLAQDARSRWQSVQGLVVDALLSKLAKIEA
jgi:hypothetical protein